MRSSSLSTLLLTTDTQIGFLAIFFLFMVAFWSVALNNYFNEIKFYDEFGVKKLDMII